MQNAHQAQDNEKQWWTEPPTTTFLQPERNILFSVKPEKVPFRTPAMTKDGTK